MSSSNYIRTVTGIHAWNPYKVKTENIAYKQPALLEQETYITYTYMDMAHVFLINLGSLRLAPMHGVA